MSTWQALTDWIVADLTAYLGAAGDFEDAIVQEIVENAWMDPQDLRTRTTPFIYIMSSDWSPIDEAHAGGYAYKRMYDYYFVIVARDAQAPAMAIARTIVERIESRVRTWQNVRRTQPITNLSTGDSVNSFTIRGGSLRVYRATSSALPDARYGIGELNVAAMVNIAA